MLRFGFHFYWPLWRLKPRGRETSPGSPPLVLHTFAAGSFPEPWMTTPKAPEPQLLGIVGSTSWPKSPVHEESPPLFPLGFRKLGGGDSLDGHLSCPLNSQAAPTGQAHTVCPVQPTSLHSFAFCHSGSVLLSHSVTSSPHRSTCHSKDFKYRLALGDSDTYQWIQVSTHARSSLKDLHSPNDSNTVPLWCSPTVTGSPPHTPRIEKSQ